MSLTIEEVTKIAWLARLELAPDQIGAYTRDLSSILDFVLQMDGIDTAAIAPMAHPLDQTQRLRPDAVTETDQRAEFQAHAPAVDAGLYLVPKVIE